MTTPTPLASEPVRQSPPAAPDAAPPDRRELRRLWLLTAAITVVVLIATVGLLAWQWLGSASGTVAR